MTEKKEEKKMVQVRRADGSKVYVAAQNFGSKPDKLFRWNDDCRRSLGN